MVFCPCSKQSCVDRLVMVFILQCWNRPFCVCVQRGYRMRINSPIWRGEVGIQHFGAVNVVHACLEIECLIKSTRSTWCIVLFQTSSSSHLLAEAHLGWWVFEPLLLLSSLIHGRWALGSLHSKSLLRICALTRNNMSRFHCIFSQERIEERGCGSLCHQQSNPCLDLRPTFCLLLSKDDGNPILVQEHVICRAI